jgi:hypothetical protein
MLPMTKREVAQYVSKVESLCIVVSTLGSLSDELSMLALHYVQLVLEKNQS